MMRLEYDAEHDILYIHLCDAAVHHSRGNQDVSRIVDYDENGEVVGIEILGASRETDAAPALQALAAAVKSHAEASGVVP